MDTYAEPDAVTLSKKLRVIFSSLDPNHPPPLCPIRDVFAPVSDRWSVLVLIFLGIESPLRFSALKRRVYGVTPKVLTQRLRELEAEGYLTRTVTVGVPVQVDYSLTPLGRSFLERCLGLFAWLEEQRTLRLAQAP